MSAPPISTPKRAADDLPQTGPTNGKPRDTPAVDPWPDPPAREAFHGIAGELVDLIDPYTESDPIAVLGQLLVGFGNLVGKDAYFRVEGDCHAANLFLSLVGPTAKGRKGTSLGQARRILARVDEQWEADRIHSGLSSGEGLIWAVRDPITKVEAIRDKGRVVDYQDVVHDPGVTDKRLLIVEPELASVLKVIQREKNTLSAIVRDAWDRDKLRTLTKNSPAKSTGCHISIIGHITRDELRQTVAETEMANGFCNRFLWFCVNRSKCLPESPILDDGLLEPYIGRLVNAVEIARGAGHLKLDENARELWARVYPQLSEGKPGLLGAVTSRAEAQVMRLALVYALLDADNAIRVDHLMAALAVWDYAEASARYIFGSRLGNPVADEIRAILKSRPDGMSRTDLSGHFSRNRSSYEIGVALRMLADSGMARVEFGAETGGRPREIWFPM